MMEINEIGKILNAKFKRHCICKFSCAKSQIENLLTDSRNYFRADKTLFFAIQTPGGNDGHKYIQELYEKGVRNFIIEKVPEGIKNYNDINIIIVPDVVEALMEVGKIHRRYAKHIVAITGSRGKTTLKEMLFQIMSPFKNISRSPRSFNSKIGVPLSLWQISENSDLAIIEAGISKTGEMKKLAETIEPDTVILTNIGFAHSNGFSSQEEKTLEKSLLTYPASVKTVIYPMDSKLITESLKKISKDKKLIGWSLKNENAELFLQLKGGNESNKEDKILEYEWKGERYSLKVKIVDEYDLENIAGVLAFSLNEGLSYEILKDKIENLHKINTRLKVAEGKNDCSIILDSYTSDLSSLLPVIDFARRRKIPGQKITLIISDLQHETGKPSKVYESLSKLVETTGIEKFIGIGETISNYKEKFGKKTVFYNYTEDFLENISSNEFKDEIILIKGAPGFGFERIYEQLESRKHETVLEVNLDAMLRNYNYFRSHLPPTTGIIAMVKASGYGAGSHEIAKTLQDAGAAYLAVAVADEGIDLRQNGIIMPIMVMNPRIVNYNDLFRNNLEPVVYSMSMLQTLISEAEKNQVMEYPFHIKLDTGMHRMGFMDTELKDLIYHLQKSKRIKVSSIFSHLATADCIDMDEYTLEQIKRFEAMSEKIRQSLDYDIKRHILNSAGILRFPEYSFDLVRLGIGLYGANTLPIDIEKPLSVVSTLKTVIICIREVEEGEAVGYGRKGLIKGKRKIATLPVGYADGINRKFGNGSLKVMINGKEAPTIGNICMDATMIDITGIDCREGDSVEIFGPNMSLQNMADILDTIPYEILTSVSPRVKRLYYRE